MRVLLLKPFLAKQRRSRPFVSKSPPHFDHIKLDKENAREVTEIL